MRWLSVLCALIAACFVRAANYTNPILLNGADPFIVWDNATSQYIFLHTVGDSIQFTTAKTLDGLRANPDRQIRYSNFDLINATTTWAPEVHKLWDNWYLYYTFNNTPYAVEIGDNINNDFNSSVSHKLSDQWGIDGTVLNLDPCYYFVWSCLRTLPPPNLQNETHQSLCIAKFNSPLEIDNSTIGVISQPVEGWEQHGLQVNEGPMALYWQNETYFCATAYYSLGLLHYTGGDPLSADSWAKRTQGPVLESSNGNYGTGHNAIFTSPDGTELWNVYHATQNPEGACDTSRATFVARVNTTNFDPATGPTFPSAGYYSQILSGPSGEQEWPETINDAWPGGLCYECWTNKWN